MVVSAYADHLVSVTVLLVFVDDTRSRAAQWWHGSAYLCDANLPLKRSGEPKRNRYCNEVLDTRAVPHFDAMSSKIARSSCTLAFHRIHQCDWHPAPTRSHRCDRLTQQRSRSQPNWALVGRIKQQLNSPNNIIRNMAELLTEINRIWDDIPQAYIRPLIQSCRWRVAAVIVSDGDFTRYWHWLICEMNMQ